MANAKLLLAPSVCYENCPLSILEAHSMGVPVVTMNSGGMAELVEDGKTGALINEPTPEAVAAGIISKSAPTKMVIKKPSRINCVVESHRFMKNRSSLFPS